ncbi:MerR family transcriptional regulator [Pseudalkalibacillus hwajinpoensis]|uniref:MerR family transcriptional regulator n=1 Tax=Guptibacillus hwajinpoensis TaxID=208199 RepID=UPI001CD1D401|nr:MerR family transcriptional regulator [Pseudalkalibacillus hwajinpoensis]MCA0993749.1 MerR family transcriptional regulator [Pseudalkalibacillus hwajinpoensis]
MKYYSMKEITVLTNQSASAIRYYEKEEILPSIERDANGVRRYTENNLEWLHFILALRSTNMPIAEIKRYVHLYKQGDSTIRERRMLLSLHKQKVEQEVKRQQNYLERISKKITLYDDVSTDLQKVTCSTY